MSLSDWPEEGSKDFKSADGQSFSAVVVLYADMRGELGGESGINKFPSTIGTLGEMLCTKGANEPAELSPCCTASLGSEKNGRCALPLKSSQEVLRRTPIHGRRP